MAAAFILICSCKGALGQTTATLDGTSGNNTISTSYSTNGNLTLGMGFYVDYLIVGGGGGGGQTQLAVVVAGAVWPPDPSR